MTSATFEPGTRCQICGVPLTVHQRALERPVCHRAECQWHFSRLNNDGRCRVCGRPLSRPSAASGVCHDVRCQRIHRERQWHRNQADLQERARRLRDSTAPALGIEDAGSFPPVWIPAFEAPVVNLPERRRRAFRDRLTSIISEAVGRPCLPSETARAHPAGSALELGPLLGRACATCRGFCCRNGGDHAYINADTIRRYLSCNPGQRPRHVLDAYRSLLGNKTYRNSCIFHEPGGCGLPRELRSDTCNHHFCAGLQGLQRQYAGSGPGRAFFVSAQGRDVKALVFADPASLHDEPG